MSIFVCRVQFCTHQLFAVFINYKKFYQVFKTSKPRHIRLTYLNTLLLQAKHFVSKLLQLCKRNSLLSVNFNKIFQFCDVPSFIDFFLYEPVILDELGMFLCCKISKFLKNQCYRCSLMFQIHFLICPFKLYVAILIEMEIIRRY